MKKILKDMLVSLLTGICFAIGLVIVMLVTDNTSFSSGDDDYLVEIPSEVSVASHSILQNKDRFTVVGEVCNDASHDWKSVWVDLEVFVGSALMNRCFEVTDRIPAKSSTTFEVKCDWTTGTDLPDKIRYTLRVTNGNR